MRRRRFVLLTAVTAVTVLTEIAAATGAASGAGGHGARAIPDVTTLFGQAVRTVRSTQRPTYAQAIVLEADGMTRGGVCTPQGCSGGRGVTSAAGIVGWRFVFDNQKTQSRFASATILYGPAPRRFGQVKGYTQPFLEDVRIPSAPRMTLSQAVAIVRRAGYRKPFFSVTLRNPLGPKRLHPLYIFGFANAPIAVDTVTRKVVVPTAGLGSTGHIWP